jgi:cytochrome c oxidase subunit 3/cytochrome o ubiquinol oxidase subunit 3
MSTVPVLPAIAEQPWLLPSRGRVGMFALITAESAIFSIFVVAYIFYLGKSLVGPTPGEVLAVPVLNTICLLSSSFTIYWAERAVRMGRIRTFGLWWFATFALGAKFLLGTALEFHRLWVYEGLTFSRNLFGTTYYSLVGLHAVHVTVGLTGIVVVLLFTIARMIKREHAERIGVFALYWHFVDVVWVVVFTVVYVVGR